jgi:PAS domain-containing protein
VVSLRALRGEFGPVVPHLPPIDQGTLPARLQRRLQQFAAQMASTVGADDPPHAVIRAAGMLFPGASFTLCPSVHHGPPSWMLHNFFGEPSSSLVHNSTLLPRVAQYRHRSDDPFANRAANLSTLFTLWDREESPAFDFAYGTVFEPNGLHHQLRAVLYDEQGRSDLYVGFFRPRGGPSFTLDEHVLLQIALPTFRSWNRVARAIGLHPLGDHALVTALDANAAPSWLVDAGRVVFANRAARAISRVPGWVTAPAAGAPARRVALTPHGHPLTLVLGHEPKMVPKGNTSIAALPPSLRAVARLAAEGQRDKEIAQQLGMPLMTVRTYLARVYHRLGVHGRRELMLRR